MKSLRRSLVLVTCMTALAANASAQAASAPSVVLRQIAAPEVYYPPIAEAARVSGKVDVRVDVRPDGSVAAVTIFPQADTVWKLLHVTALDAASRASFECRDCTQPLTPHTMTFVFSFDEVDGAGNRLPTTWKQTGETSSDVRVLGRVPVIHVGPPTKPFHIRAARCLWLWHCSKEAYVTPIR